MVTIISRRSGLSSATRIVFNGIILGGTLGRPNCSRVRPSLDRLSPQHEQRPFWVIAVRPRLPAPLLALPRALRIHPPGPGDRGKVPFGVAQPVELVLP